MVSTSQEQYYLKIIAKTWSRDSHGLFDYEANNTKNILLTAYSNAKLIRKRNDVRLHNENTEIDLEERELLKIRLAESK